MATKGTKDTEEDISVISVNSVASFSVSSVAQKLNVTLNRTNRGAMIDVGRSQAAPLVA